MVCVCVVQVRVVEASSALAYAKLAATPGKAKDEDEGEDPMAVMPTPPILTHTTNLTSSTRDSSRLPRLLLSPPLTLVSPQALQFVTRPMKPVEVKRTAGAGRRKYRSNFSGAGSQREPKVRRAHEPSTLFGIASSLCFACVLPTTLLC